MKNRMFSKQFQECVAGGAIALASFSILPSKEGYAQSSDASFSGTPQLFFACDAT